MADKLHDPVWLRFRATVLTELKRLGLRQYELAKRVGVAPSSVVGWLREGSLPRGQALMNLANVLGLEPSDLVPGSGRAAPMQGEAASERLTGGRLVLAELDDLLRELKERWESQGRAQAVASSEAHQQRQRAPKRRTQGS